MSVNLQLFDRLNVPVSQEEVGLELLRFWIEFDHFDVVGVEGPLSYIDGLFLLAKRLDKVEKFFKEVEANLLAPSLKPVRKQLLASVVPRFEQLFLISRDSC